VLLELAHRLAALGAALRRASVWEQVVAGLSAGLGEFGERVPDPLVADREHLGLLALGEDLQASAFLVEVLEADASEGALTDPVEEQQPERDSVAWGRVRGEDPVALRLGERPPARRPCLGAFDRQRRVAVEAAAADLPLEEAMHDREVLVEGARRRGSPAPVEEVLDERRAGGELEVGEVAAGEVLGELAERGGVAFVAGVGQAPALRGEVVGDVLLERLPADRGERLWLHGS
jgi:hypothetical protein